MDLTTIEGIQRQLKRLSQQICCANSSVSELPVIQSGTYTPTITINSNVTTATPRVSQYLRVHNVVTVSGIVDIEAAAIGTASINISIPISSTFNADEEAAGTAANNSAASNAIPIIAGATDNVIMAYQATTTNQEAFVYHFTYLITVTPP